MEVPFNKGSFKNSEVALINLIKKQIGKKEILESIGLSSVNDLYVAGYKVFTTLEEPLQQATQLSMKRHLSRIETILSDFKPEPASEFKKLKNLEKNSFVYGKVDRIEGNNPKILKFMFPLANHKGLSRINLCENFQDFSAYPTVKAIVITSTTYQKVSKLVTSS